MIEHYNHALDSFNPASQFLYFYHVIEHFFDSIVIEEARQELRTAITKTGFSSSNNKHLEEVLRVIKDKVAVDTDGSLKATREFYSLKLVLKKFVGLGDFKSSLSNQTIEYYRSNKVAFADTSQVNFNDDQSFIETLSKRIYQTRNAIVHSKEYNSYRYKPSQNRGNLAREIPLIRAVAEIIIEKSSEIADFV